MEEQADPGVTCETRGVDGILALALEGAPVAVVCHMPSPPYTIVFANTTSYELLGYLDGELLGISTEEIVAPDKHRLFRHVTRSRPNGPKNFVAITHGGTEIPVLIWGTQIPCTTPTECPGPRSCRGIRLAWLMHEDEFIGNYSTVSTLRKASEPAPEHGILPDSEIRVLEDATSVITRRASVTETIEILHKTRKAPAAPVLRLLL